MNSAIRSVKELQSYYQDHLKHAQKWSLFWAAASILFFGAIGYFADQPVLYGFALLTTVAIFLAHRYQNRLIYSRLVTLKSSTPVSWQKILDNHSVFYQNLTNSQKAMFEKRVQIFLSEKRIEGIDTDVDETVRILAAASGIIPTFAFPAFNYPTLNEVLIYPASFSQKFEIGGPRKQQENIEGMVGNGYMNHSLLLSKPALLAGFNGRVNEENVGIHEFVHLLDREDGVTDGIPERLIEHQYTVPWLHLIKEEMQKIRRGRSDINPYAITNNAEFLAVVSEYFFSDPEDFRQKHEELYSFLSDFYNQRPS